jgi:hypothetical protein
MILTNGGRVNKTAIAVVAIHVLSSAAYAQGAAPASEIRLTIRIPNGQTAFRVGEAIPLELSFSSGAPQKYQIDMASYGFGGRANYERFIVEPHAGWSDPLDLYFRSGGATGAAMSGFSPVSQQPIGLPLDLNEWVRFDQPGEYRVTVESHRAALRAQPAQSAAVVSNELRIAIVAATPEWQRETLQKALAALNSPPAPGVRSPAKTLRYLGTEAAARAMAHRTQDPDCWLGLMGSPFRAAGLNEMMKLLRDPGFPVDRQFLDTLAFLAIPDSPGLHVQERNAFYNRFQQELIAALPIKKGAALAASVRTIVDNPHEADPAVRQSLIDSLAANFDELPMGMQSDLVNSRYGMLDRVLLVPMVRKMAERYLNSPPLQPAEAAEFNRLGGDALMRWYSLAPADARPAILREILRPQPRFPIDVLGVLSEPELPEADRALVSHLESAESANDRAAARNLAFLIGRYATAAAGTELVARLDRDVAAGFCDTQAPLLAWLLRVDPEGARPRLENAGKAGNRCRLSLAEIGKLRQAPILDSLAAKALDDPDAAVEIDATAYLADYGSADAEETLWSHFADWSKHWRDREAALSPFARDAQVGQSLMQALVAGHSWLMSDAKLRRLADLAVGAPMRQQAEQYFRMWQQKPWVVSCAGYDQFQIGWYHALSMKAAKEKLLQFPKGTELRWIVQGLPDEPAELHELAGFALAHGIKLW